MSIDQPEIKAEILQCPVSGCDRKVVGDSAALQNHVRNSEDEAHRWVLLDEEGEIKSSFDWR